MPKDRMAVVTVILDGLLHSCEDVTGANNCCRELRGSRGGILSSISFSSLLDQLDGAGAFRRYPKN